MAPLLSVPSVVPPVSIPLPHRPSLLVPGLLMLQVRPSVWLNQDTCQSLSAAEVIVVERLDAALTEPLVWFVSVPVVWSTPEYDMHPTQKSALPYPGMVFAVVITRLFVPLAGAVSTKTSLVTFQLAPVSRTCEPLCFMLTPFQVIETVPGTSWKSDSQVRKGFVPVAMLKL